MANRMAYCAYCHRHFRLDRYNAHRQKYCTNPTCVRERKRKRQREYYARRRANDSWFRQKENIRCAEANRRRRAAAKDGDESALVPSLTVMPAESYAQALLGLLSQLAGSNDPAEVGEFLACCTDRGRRLALLAPFGRSPP